MISRIKWAVIALVTLVVACSKTDSSSNTTTTVPLAPTNLSASAVSSSIVSLNWTDNSTNEDGYKIERKIAGGAYTPIVTLAKNVTSFFDSSVTKNITYTYRVYAYNAIGSSASYSNEASATPSNIATVIPITPSNLSTVVVSSSKVSLSWTDNSNNESGFKIERKISSGVYSPLATIAANVTAYSDSTVTINTTYTYRVYSFNSAGASSSYSNESSATPTTTTSGIPVVVTSPITNITSLTATGGGNVTSDGGNAVVNKGIVWSTTPNPTYPTQYVAFSGTGTGVFTNNITSLTQGVTYYVRAFAYNTKGIGYGASISFVATPQNVPTLTTNSATNITNSTVTIGGNITSDGNSAVIERGVCWNTTGKPVIDYIYDKKISDGTTGTGSFTNTITGLILGKTYHVRAYASNGNGTNYGQEVVFTTSTIATTFSLGLAYGGGIVFYIDGTGKHGLIVDTSGISSTPWWDPNCIDGTGFYVPVATGATGTAIFTGLTNSNTIVSVLGSSSNNMAKAARSYRGAGYNDWFLPSKEELNQLYINRAYTRFTSGGYYKSSSETTKSSDSKTYVWSQDFYTGLQTQYDSKSNPATVIAVRAF